MPITKGEMIMAFLGWKNDYNEMQLVDDFGKNDPADGKIVLNHKYEYECMEDISCSREDTYELDVNDKPAIYLKQLVYSLDNQNKYLQPLIEVKDGSAFKADELGWQIKIVAAALGEQKGISEEFKNANKMAIEMMKTILGVCESK